MPNPLQSEMPPDAPQPGAPPQGNALTAPLPGGQGGLPAPAQPQNQQQNQPAPPSHQQTVAALRHFAAINTEFREIMQNPNLGKTDAKSSIIDAVTKLVADRIVAPSAAVVLLGQVPDKPLDQQKWAQKLYMQNEMAANMILDHHRQGFQGAPDDVAAQGAPYDPEQHQEAVNGLMTHYKGRR